MILKDVQSMYVFPPPLFSLEKVSRTSVTAALLNTQASEWNSYGSFSITLQRPLFGLANAQLDSTVFLLYPNATCTCLPFSLLLFPQLCTKKKKRKKKVVLFWSARPLVKTSAEQVSPVSSLPGLWSLHPISLLFSISTYLSLYKNRSLSSQKIWVSKSLKPCGVLLFTTSSYPCPGGVSRLQCLQISDLLSLNTVI